MSDDISYAIHAPRRHRERGFTTLEFLIAVGISMALFGLSVPVYLGVRASAYNDSVKDSVYGTVKAVESQVLTKDLTDFNETTPGLGLVKEDATIIKITGPNNTGSGTAEGFEVRGWNPNSPQYSMPDKAYFYTTATGEFTSLED